MTPADESFTPVADVLLVLSPAVGMYSCDLNADVESLSSGFYLLLSVEESVRSECTRCRRSSLHQPLQDLMFLNSMWLLV